jgi:hypothetical protein
VDHDLTPAFCTGLAIDEDCLGYHPLDAGTRFATIDTTHFDMPFARATRTMHHHDVVTLACHPHMTG